MDGDRGVVGEEVGEGVGNFPRIFTNFPEISGNRGDYRELQHDSMIITDSPFEYLRNDI